MANSITAKETREYLISTILPSHGVIEINNTDKKISKVIDHYGKHQGFFPNIGVLFHRAINLIAALLFIGTEKKRGKQQAKVLVETKYFKNDTLKSVYEKANDKKIKGAEKKEAKVAVKWADRVSKELGSMLVDTYIEVTKVSVENKELLNAKCVEIFKKNFTEEKINKVLANRPKNLTDTICQEICHNLIVNFQKDIVVTPPTP